MKRILLFLICATASLAAFAQPTSSAPVADPSAPIITFETMEYNFDSVVQGDTVKYTFTFKNTGKSPLIISDVQVGCGCTVPKYSKEPIAPGKKGTIYVEFRSAGKMGVQDKPVTVISNSGGGNVVLHLKGTVQVKPAAAPADTRPGPVNK
jgi:hypothetical protein